MEKLGIEQLLTPHDALSDAKNTALIASKLDMVKGIEQYGKLDNSGICCSTILTSLSNGYLSLMDAHRQSVRTKTICPFCKNELETKGWIGKRTKRIALASCQEHGTFKFQNVIYKKGELYYIKRKISYASEDMKKSYAEQTSGKEIVEVM